MSEPSVVESPKNTPRGAYALQLDNIVSPHSIVPCTPQSNILKQGDNKLSLGFWSVNFFKCSNFLLPPCSCVSIAQSTRRLDVVSSSTTLLFFAIVCTLELVVLGVMLHQFIFVEVLGHNVRVFYYHAHRIEKPRHAVDPFFGTVALLAHATIAAGLWNLRQRIRKYFQIPGTKSNDCVAVTCCPCFATAQMAMQIKSCQPDLNTFDTLPCYQ